MLIPFKLFSLLIFSGIFHEFCSAKNEHESPKKLSELNGLNVKLEDKNASDEEIIQIKDGKMIEEEGRKEKPKTKKDDELKGKEGDNGKNDEEKPQNGKKKQSKEDGPQTEKKEIPNLSGGEGNEGRKRKMNRRKDDDGKSKEEDEIEEKLKEEIDPETYRHSCIFDNGIIIENGVARSATKAELAKMREYLLAIKKEQEKMMRIGNEKIRLMRKAAEKEISPKIAAILENSDEDPEKMAPNPPCLCRKNCKNLMILNTSKI